MIGASGQRDEFASQLLDGKQNLIAPKWRWRDRRVVAGELCSANGLQIIFCDPQIQCGSFFGDLGFAGESGKAINGHALRGNLA